MPVSARVRKINGTSTEQRPRQQHTSSNAPAAPAPSTRRTQPPRGAPGEDDRSSRLSQDGGSIGRVDGRRLETGSEVASRAQSTPKRSPKRNPAAGHFYSRCEPARFYRCSEFYGVLRVLVRTFYEVLRGSPTYLAAAKELAAPAEPAERAP